MSKKKGKKNKVTSEKNSEGTMNLFRSITIIKEKQRSKSILAP